MQEQSLPAYTHFCNTERIYKPHSRLDSLELFKAKNAFVFSCSPVQDDSNSKFINGNFVIVSWAR